MNCSSIKTLAALFYSISTVCVSGVELNFGDGEEATPPVVSDGGGVEMNFGEDTDDLGVLDEDNHSDSGFWGRTSLTGELEARYQGYYQDSPREDRNHFGEGSLTLDWSGQITDSLNFVVKPQLNLHTADRVKPEFRFLERQRKRPLVTFDEVVLSYYHNEYEISVGKQIFSWGVSDGVKPMDVINPNDYLTIPDEEKIAIPAINLVRTGEWFTVQGVVVPWFAPDRLPEPDNRWASDDYSVNRGFRSNFGFNPSAITSDRGNLPAQEIENIQFGMQLSSSSLISGWDFYLNYFRGFDTTGVQSQSIALTRVSPTPGLVPPVPVAGTVAFTTFYPEYHQLGGAFSTTWNDFEFHGEMVWHKTVEEAQDDDYIQYVIGTNYTLDQNLPEMLEKITVVLEYAGERITRQRPASSPFAAASLGRSFTNAAITSIKFKFDEENKFELGGIYNFDEQDFVIGAAFEREVIENLTMELGYQMFQGDNDTFYGGWDENDRVYLNTTYYF